MNRITFHGNVEAGKSQQHIYEDYSPIRSNGTFNGKHKKSNQYKSYKWASISRSSNSDHFHSLSLSICWAFDFFTTPLLSRLQLFIQIKNSLYGAPAIIDAIVRLFLFIRKYATKTKLLFSCDHTQKIFMIFSNKII